MANELIKSSQFFPAETIPMVDFSFLNKPLSILFFLTKYLTAGSF